MQTKNPVWFDVKTVVPDNDRQILLFIPKSHDFTDRIRIGYYHKDMETFYILHNGHPVDPTYWAELPKPPVSEVQR